MTDTAALELRGIKKFFGSVAALEHVDLAAFREKFTPSSETTAPANPPPSRSSPASTEVMAATS